MPSAPRGLDESCCGDGLPRSSRVAEAVAADCARVGAVERGLELLLVDEAGVEVVVGLLVDLGLGDGSVPAAVLAASSPFPFSSAARCVEAMSSVSIPVSASTWWRRSSVPGRGARGLLGQDALEAEHEPVAHLPAGGGRLAGRRPSPRRRRRAPRAARCRARARPPAPRRDGGRARRTRLRPGGPQRSGPQVVRRQRRGSRRFVHTRSTYVRAAPSEELTLAFSPASGTAAAYLRRRPCKRGDVSSRCAGELRQRAARSRAPRPRSDRGAS